MSFLGRWFPTHLAPRAQTTVSVDLFSDDFLNRLETLALVSRRAAAGVRRGERRSRKKGSGVEFADHRPYVAGDDIRFLDLSVYQRLGKLLLRVYEEEEDLSLYFLIDTSASMGAAGGRKLNQAVQVAAALSYVGLSSLDRVSIVAVSDQVVQRMPPTRGKQRILRVLKFLSDLRVAGRTDLAQAAKTFVAQHKRRGLAIILTDLFDPRGFEAGINVLRFNRFEPCVLHVIDPRDAEVALDGDLQVVDIESQKSRDVTVTPRVRKHLRERFAEHQEHVARFCTARGVPYFPVDVGEPFDEVVLGVLRAGGLLR